MWLIHGITLHWRKLISLFQQVSIAGSFLIREREPVSPASQCWDPVRLWRPLLAATVSVNSYAHPVVSTSHCSLGVIPHLWLSQSPHLLFHRDPMSVHCSTPHSGLWQIQGESRPVKHKACTVNPVTKVRLQGKALPGKAEKPGAVIRSRWIRKEMGF